MNMRLALIAVPFLPLLTPTALVVGAGAGLVGFASYKLATQKTHVKHRNAVKRRIARK